MLANARESVDVHFRLLPLKTIENDFKEKKAIFGEFPEFFMGAFDVFR